MRKSSLLLGALLISGCTIETIEKAGPAPVGSGSGSGTGSGAEPTNPGGGTSKGVAAGKAEVRVVHGSPDAPAVDVWVKGLAQPVITGLSYGDASRYLEVDEGSYDFELRASPSKASDAVAYSIGMITLKSQTRSTAIAAGLLGSSSADSKFRVLALADSTTAVPTGKARVRVVHASPDAPTVGVDVGDDNVAAPEIAGLARVADVAGVQLPANNALQIGIGASGKRVTAFTTPRLPDGGDLTVIATGLLGRLPREKDGFSLLAISSAGAIGFIKQNPIVYALHASPDAPAIDAYAGSARAIDNLPFGQLAGPLQVQPGDLTIKVFGAGAAPSGKPVAEPTLTDLRPGERYLSIATGFLSPPAGAKPFQVLAFAESFALDDTKNARARVVHASPNAPAVDAGPVAGGGITPAVANLAFGKSTQDAGLSLPGPNLLLGVTPADQSNNILARFTLPTLAPSRSFVVAAGVLGHSTRPFRLAVVDTTPSPWAISHVFAH